MIVQVFMSVIFCSLCHLQDNGRTLHAKVLVKQRLNLHLTYVHATFVPFPIATFVFIALYPLVYCNLYGKMCNYILTHMYLHVMYTVVSRFLVPHIAHCTHSHNYGIETVESHMNSNGVSHMRLCHSNTVIT